MALPAVVGHLRATYDVEIAVALTEPTRRLVAPAALTAVSAHPVIPSHWSAEPGGGPLHVTWAKWPDLMAGVAGDARRGRLPPGRTGS
ncbi:hypothetical protein [Nonomuraea lactucae]|uniref:hypothetical protein n=1 Tax=Nonomuraea lactucae TaxID=2249762 RepID=UPI000DE49E36|nr:hypothetical protein [Nonomuraea lactucae]